MTPHDQKTQLVLRARELGVDLLRVSPAWLPEHYTRTFRDWVAAGLHADMGYLARRIETGVALGDLQPGARSVVCIGLSYWRGPEDAPIASDHGQVSRYAVSRDYHRVIGGVLKPLRSFIETELGGQARAFVDIGPVLERAHAEHGGMGYIGRNTMLITPQHGSWLFLAALITDLDLPPDLEPVHLRCGACRRCVTACPTAAIRDDHTIDSARCISYLTIENHDGIPEPLRPAVGNWLFGCDICQEVCPHNHSLPPTRIPDLAQSRIPGRALDLAAILAIPDDAAYTARFAGTPLMRAKRRGLQRNACVVAGNSGDPSLRPALLAFLARETDPMLREHAEWALARLSSPPPPAPADTPRPSPEAP